MAPDEPIWIGIGTALGIFTAGFSGSALVRLEFPETPVGGGRRGGEHPLLEVTRGCLEEMLAGRVPDSLPPLDLFAGTEFQRAVWETMLTIPLGDTMTYGEIARRIGNPDAARAVGGACGANPIPVIVPCHRVLGGAGIGGFSSGLDWKIKLLQIEGVALL